jgi:uncharacterized protein (TIGR00725 family)
VVGILPGADRADANRHLTLALATGLGEVRNVALVNSADTIIAIGGGWGTLSEIALGMSRGRPVIALDTWPVDGLQVARSPEEAVRLALD